MRFNLEPNSRNTIQRNERLEYIEGPWHLHVDPPVFLNEQASCKVHDPDNTLIATIKSNYKPIAGKGNICSIINSLQKWQTTASLIRCVPEMYETLVRVGMLLPKKHPLKILVDKTLNLIEQDNLPITNEVLLYIKELDDTIETNGKE